MVEAEEDNDEDNGDGDSGGGGGAGGGDTCTAHLVPTKPPWKVNEIRVGMTG